MNNNKNAAGKTMYKAREAKESKTIPQECHRSIDFVEKPAIGKFSKTRNSRQIETWPIFCLLQKTSKNTKALKMKRAQKKKQFHIKTENV